MHRPVLYFVAISSEMTLVKHVINVVTMTTWTRVYYNNLLSVPFALILCFAFHEWEPLRAQVWTPQVRPPNDGLGWAALRAHPIHTRGGAVPPSCTRAVAAPLQRPLS